MDARNLYYPKCEVNLAKTESFNPEVTCKDGIIWALQDIIRALGLSKAEVFRRLRSYGVIGK